MLVISSFSKSYHEERILSIGSLVLSPGVHLIKGENGSGKTTLFKCLAGILSSEGNISIKDLSLKKNPTAYRYCVNFAEAEPIYPTFLTARDLMMFVAKTKNAHLHGNMMVGGTKIFSGLLLFGSYQLDKKSSPFNGNKKFAFHSSVHNLSAAGIYRARKILSCTAPFVLDRIELLLLIEHCIFFFRIPSRQGRTT